MPALYAIGSTDTPITKMITMSMFLATWIGRYFPKAGGALRSVHDGLAEIRASPTGLAVCFAIHITGWLGTALWAWIALHLIGRPIPFLFVFAIEAILYAIRSAAIFVPGALWSARTEASASTFFRMGLHVVLVALPTCRPRV